MLFRSPACGCRFGSGPGRFWVGVCLPLVPFRFGGVQPRNKKGTDPKTGSDPKITFLVGNPSVRCSGTLDLCNRSIASRRALGCELRDGSDGWRSPVPWGDNTGGRDGVPPPPTIAFWARRQVPKFVTGRAVDSVRDGRSSIPRRVRRCGVISHALSRQPVLPSVTLRRLRHIASQMFRPVAAGVYLSLKDVAASQFVCSRGADNLSSHFLPSGVTFLLRGSSSSIAQHVTPTNFRGRSGSRYSRFTMDPEDI